MLSDFMGKPMLLHVIDSAIRSDASEVILVTGKSTLNNLDLPGNVRTVLNNDSGEGISLSIKLGTSAVSEISSAVIILLGDMPLLTPDTINRLIGLHERFPEKPVAVSLNGMLMPPALFPRSHFRSLMDLKGDKGAREILRSGNEVISLDINVDELYDIDTVDKLKGAERFH